MKKLNIYSLFILAIIALIACDPLEDRDSIGGGISAEELDVSATPVIVNGKNSNKVILKNSSPVLSSWNYGVGTTQRQSDTVLLVLTGTTTITFTGLNPDGSEITKSLDVAVDELTFDVPAQWGYLCGSGEKTWVWDDEASSCFGNGGYLGNTSPGWWALTVDGIDEQAAGEGEGASMVFSTSGATLTKHLTDGTTQQGTFSFDMTATTLDGDGNVWAEGMLTTKGVTVLCGISINEGGIDVNDYDILSLDDSNMTLSYHADGATAWGEAWFWVFRVAD